MKAFGSKVPGVAVLVVDLEHRRRQLLRWRRLHLPELLGLGNVLDVVINVEHLQRRLQVNFQ